MFRLSVLIVALAALPALAEEPRREFIYGGQLMTRKERAQYRSEHAAAKDGQAREQLRERHRARMQERAKKRGIRLDKDGVMPLLGK